MVPDSTLTNAFPAQSLTVQIALMAIVVAGLSIYMIATRNRVRRSIHEPHAPARERYAELQQRTRLARDLEEVMGDLDELARQVNGKLDLRFAKLEAVIRDADARIDELTRLLRSSRGEPTLDITVADGDPVYDARNPRGDVRSPVGTTEGPPPDRPLHAEVYELADRGVSPVDIAEQTNRTAGEVELILALRRAKTREGGVAARTS